MNFKHFEAIVSCNLLDNLPFDMDKRMNDAGLLRLMVSDPLAMNMSNTLGYLRGELNQAAGRKKRASICK
jgi:hypothetical protein